MRSSFDVIIVGGGMVGLTTACALAQKTNLSIAVLEAGEALSAPHSNDYHHRVSAISLSSRRIFSSLGVWKKIQGIRVSPFYQIDVWDAAGKGNIHFDASAVAEPVLGYIIENNVIQSALEEKVKTFPNVTVLTSVQLSAYTQHERVIELTATNGKVFEAALVIAADGAGSWLRNQVGMSVKKVDYEQLGLVATVSTSLPHEKIARQVFLSTGPLGFLPLSAPHLSSIVWSVPLEEGQRLLALDESAFKNALTKAFDHRLGDIVECSQRFSFPLFQQQASAYVKQRIALVGDAAHVMHPLAGQGVNTGLLDAASLVEVVAEACQQNRDFSSYATLRRYERWRKADNQQMMLGIDWIKKLFSNEKQSAIHLRHLGLSMTNQISVLKNVFIRHAVGDRKNLPLLAQ